MAFFKTLTRLDARADEFDRLQFFVGVLLLGSACGRWIYWAVTGLPAGGAGFIPKGMVAWGFFLLINVGWILITRAPLIRIAWALSIATAVLATVSPLGSPTVSAWLVRQLIAIVFFALLLAGSAGAARGVTLRGLAVFLFVAMSAMSFWAQKNWDDLVGRSSIMVGW